MKTSKPEQIKEKSKSKTPCSSKQASQFLEREGYDLSLNFKGLAVSLNDFFPNQSESVRSASELDFDIANQMKKLEKKDAGTKQKALIELNDLINSKDVDIVVGMLRYWPKVYNRLSVDEDKRIRELCQEVMSNLARLCGKSLGPYIKQILPTWIFSQSDVHVPAAALATSSFESTFLDHDRRHKAYLLCWDEIAVMISTSTNKSPPSIAKEKTPVAISEVPQETLTVSKEAKETKAQSGKERKESTSLSKKGIKDSSEKNIMKEGSSDTAKESNVKSKNEWSPTNIDAYCHDLVIHLRTLITLLPYVGQNPQATQDLSQWLHSKQFWAHYRVGAPTNIIAMYLTLSTDLLTYVPHLVQDTPFIIGHVAQSLRLVDNYHSVLVPLVWTSIIKCVVTLGDKLWTQVSFSSTFLPKWLRMLECGTDGRVSLASSFMLPFFTKLPIDTIKSDSAIVFTRIFEAMTKGLLCTRIRHSHGESNCMVRTILECATYTILSARTAANEPLKERVLAVVWRLIEQYVSEPDCSKADKTVELFCQVALRPLINKEVIGSTQIIDIVTGWIEKYYISGNALFIHHLCTLITEFGTLQVSGQSVLDSVMEALQMTLLGLVVDTESCLLPLLSVISSSSSLSSTTQSQLTFVFKQCTHIIDNHTHSLTSTIARAMAMILNHLPQEALQLYRHFIASLTHQQSLIFFDDFYGQFLAQLSSNIGALVAEVTLFVWQQSLTRELESILSGSDTNIVGPQESRTFSLAFQHCEQSLLHRPHLADILLVLDSFITRTTETVVTVEALDTMIALTKYAIEETHAQFTVSMIPRSMVLSLVKMLLSAANTTTESSIDLLPVQVYLEHISADEDDIDLFVQVLDQVLLDNSHQTAPVAQLVAMVLTICPDQSNIIDHLDQMLERDMRAIDVLVSHQQRYSSSLVQPDLLLDLLHKLDVFIQLPRPWPNQLTISLDHCCLLLTPVLLATFSTCHQAIHILRQCESVYTHTSTITIVQLTQIIDLMLIASDVQSNVPILGQCPTLLLAALNHFIPSNYSQWSHSVLSSVDLAIHSWTDLDLSPHQLSLTFTVLIPCAIRANYLVQELVLASISSLLSEETDPSLGQINRALVLIKSLTATNSSFFEVCFPLLMAIKTRFQCHMDQLYDAQVINTTDHIFDLSSLLEIIIVGVDSSILTHSQWDFILCLVSTLCRSPQFIDSSDFTLHSITDNIDHIFNSVLLLRLIASVSLAMASVINNSVLDEWDHFFSQPIFTTILDLFSLLSGDHIHGRIISSHLFTFYIEALSEVVSLCPVSVLLAHHSLSSSSQVHINDPIELPKDFLLVFNSLLESLSSYSLSTQLAAYNCLLNLTDHLSGLLFDQITKLEDSNSDSLESLSISLPYKLVSYLQSDDLLSLSIDGRLENEIVFTRCFLAWTILLQLFSSSQPKVRAEITSFLVTHDRCFDKFLNFCFSFIPKSPLINKKHVTFLSVHGRQSCNLITDEPHIFTKCVEKRSKFILYHLSSYVFRRSVQVLPNHARGWFLSLDGQRQQQVEIYMRQYLTPELFKIEFRQLREAVGTELDERLDIQALPVIGEVTVRYNVPGDQCLEQVITLPNNYPIGRVSVDFKKEMKVKIPHWKSWIIQMTSTMQNQNGSILDGVKLWKKNLDNHFDGVEECMICYSILHALKYTLPSMKCRQCKKKFHKDCMYKWFQSSTNPTCPNCRNVFYDGTYKRSQYGENDL